MSTTVIEKLDALDEMLERLFENLTVGGRHGVGSAFFGWGVGGRFGCFRR